MCGCVVGALRVLLVRRETQGSAGRRRVAQGNAGERRVTQGDAG